MSDNCPDDIELHKPYIDAVELNCPECGGKMHRVSEVIDCWFDSGSMPFAQWHYPFENKEIFDENYPADFISEAIDQFESSSTKSAIALAASVILYSSSDLSTNLMSELSFESTHLSIGASFE